ncbi:SDR family NAD(P)-dependent oxidoreductase [Microlunatus antarcticus]|uniref:NAD(P)-dependent dehydrogenase (Short-subunit alcohol dehydrogenase family) n=1 Tax=Microlunatus antarcticus TaxID=53388 RepID=A0A7W5JYQ3_9ACTN|nr:SDR family NAD(P)-dependent oxidoreductase [Microlunatus antarcticus]MBB3328782.1 NAD(P)-dependent dehydrogenase (short-subunit alcohol dehydrogenase family) [Microlunatus antarcticus]
MPNQTIVITGASDGIGAAAARKLVADGHLVVLVGRSPEKTAAVARELAAPYHVADFSDLGQVRRLADELGTAYDRIDVLANNAGGIMGHRTLTGDGHELTFQVNHLAPFLLTNLLLPLLTASQAKVIQTSSIAARLFGHVVLDDLDLERGYSPDRAYGNGKLENILFTRELDRRHRSDGIAAAAFHPGVVGTNFASDTTHPMRFLYQTPVINKLFTISPERGSRGLLWLAENTPGATWPTGEYFEHNKVAKSNPQARDADLAVGLWDRSAEMVGL